MGHLICHPTLPHGRIELEIFDAELGDALIDLGCTQGCGIARPMPASEFRDWLKIWKAPASWPASRLN